jgi:hypothetical protein
MRHDLQCDVPASNRERPPFTGVNPPAWRLDRWGGPVVKSGPGAERVGFALGPLGAGSQVGADCGQFGGCLGAELGEHRRV